MPLILKKRENGYYYIRGSVRGIPVFESTRTRDEEIAERARQAREDDLIEQSINGIKAVVTFDQAANSYVEAGGPQEHILRLRPSDKTQVGLAVHFRGVKLKDIGQAELDAAAKKLFPNVRDTTRNRQVYTPFIAIWNHAVANKWAIKHEWRRPRVKKGTTAVAAASRSGTLPTSYERAWQFISAMSPAPACVMTALFYTGMRPIELFALEAKDVSVKDRWITLQSSKTGEPRGVPMHEMLVPMFDALVKRGGELFRDPRNNPYPIREDGGGQIKSAIKGARKRSGIQGISPYTARHTVSTQLVMAGVHPHIKDQILGHAVTEMSRLYTQVPQPALIEAINKLPTIADWAGAEWLLEPVKWQRRLVRNSRWKITKSVQSPAGSGITS